MNVTKDIYEYLLNFADDRDILNMLSVNKKFRDEKLFERIMKRRYPLIIRFKDEEKSWQDFYIETIFYLSKLEEKFKLQYIPTLDFNPEIIYRNSYSKKILFENIKKDIDFYRGKGYHTISYKLLNGKYKIDPNLHKEYPMNFYGLIDDTDDENIIGVDKSLKIENNAWLAISRYNGSVETSELYLNKEEAANLMFEEYLYVTQKFIDDMMAVNIDIDVFEYSNLKEDWANFEKFKEKIETDYPVVILYKNLPNMDSRRYDFQVIKVNIPN